MRKNAITVWNFLEEKGFTQEWLDYKKEKRKEYFKNKNQEPERIISHRASIKKLRENRNKKFSELPTSLKLTK